MRGGFSYIEVSRLTGIGEEFIQLTIRKEWVTPLADLQLDEEDIARLKLIAELQRDFGVNDEAIPIILHLVDQLNHVRGQVDIQQVRRFQ